ncbi:MAG: F0F1 ATP synthase subunit B [Termitinemataceae bacterium]|nr:MAG: F0F1 ATP synthase subunit B [Termitinemataceae bacterium]
MLDFTVTFVFSLLNIVVLFFFLRKVLFKPVSKFISERSKSVEETIEAANKDKENSKNLRELYETKLKTADEEAMELAKKAQDSARLHCETIIAQAQQQSENMISAARKQIDAERQAAYIAFKAEAAALVVAATGKLLRREVNTKDCENAARTILADLGKNERT